MQVSLQVFFMDFADRFGTSNLMYVCMYIYIGKGELKISDNGGEPKKGG